MMASDIRRWWHNMVITVVAIIFNAIIFNVIIFDVIIFDVIMKMMILHRTHRGKQAVINAMQFTETTTGSDSR